MTTDLTQTGILLVDKPINMVSFSLVSRLRRITQERRIGHAGTLDPLATGVMVMLIGRAYTKLSDRFLHHDKEYCATIKLGAATDTYDREGRQVASSDLLPCSAAVQDAIASFQGETLQVPPMYSAKKIGGKKLYQMARAGREIQRPASKVTMNLTLLHYQFPKLRLRIVCSKGTYIRSLADDLGKMLGCYGHLVELERSRSGPFTLNQCLDGALLDHPDLDLRPHLIRRVA